MAHGIAGCRETGLWAGMRTLLALGSAPACRWLWLSPCTARGLALDAGCCSPGLAGSLKQQIDKLADKHFRALRDADEQLNFSTAVVVMRVQNKWRAKMRAAKWKRKRLHRASRTESPNMTQVRCSAIVFNACSTWLNARHEGTLAAWLAARPRCSE